MLNQGAELLDLSSILQEIDYLSSTCLVLREKRT